MDLLAIAFDAEPHGHVLVNGRPPTMRQLASIFGVSERDADRYVGELETAGVFSVTEDHVIYSRRMIRDRLVSEQGKIDGATGGNPRLRLADKGPGLGEGLTPNPTTPLTSKKQRQKQKQEAAKPRRNRKPSCNDEPEAWSGIADRLDTDTEGTHAMVGDWQIDVLAALIADAARLPRDWRGDYDRLAEWLRAGLSPHDVILPAIKRVAARPNYVAPRSLRYFDAAVRSKQVEMV